MCPNGAGRVRTERGFMDFGLFRRLIDDVRSYVGTVTLSMGGESLLHPGLGEMAAYAGRSGLKTVLNTNATLLDEKASAALLDSGLDYVSFAFDGFTKAGYERARRGADFEATLGNILRFLRMKEERRARKPFTVLSMLDLGWDRPSGCSSSLAGDTDRRSAGASKRPGADSSSWAMPTIPTISWRFRSSSIAFARAAISSWGPVSGARSCPGP